MSGLVLVMGNLRVLLIQSHIDSVAGLSKQNPKISLSGPFGPNRRCDDLPATITHVPVAAVLVLNTPDDGRLRPKHVE